MVRKGRKVSQGEQAQAIGYVRVSTTRQAQEGVSIDAQKEKIAAWCTLHGYALVQVYVDEGISGYRAANRPGLQEALNAVCASGGVLVVYSLSRFARNTAETIQLGERLAASGADLVSLSEDINTTSAAGKMVFRMLAVLAEFERDQISERTCMAMAHLKAEGKRVGELPYGFQVADDGETLIAHPGEQAVIATFEKYRQAGLSFRQIVRQAEQEGLLSRAGKPFGLQQVHRIVKGA